MELKRYQKEVIADLKRFLEILCATRDYKDTYTQFWQDKGFPVGFGGMKPYQDILPGVPHICFKVPTGGGKTFIACNSIKPIFDALPTGKARVVVWLVPSEAILEQTLKALKNPEHPYRQKLNTCFGSRVAVYDKQQLLNGENFNITTVTEQLSVMVLSYDSFRGRKESLKSRQENSNLVSFSQALGAPENPLPDTDETALIQVINQLTPLVIVDESHHARSKLSKEMLQSFNPCFVLDLTATPREESNIISYVDAIQLKRENMVKLPVIVYNRDKIEEVIADAKDLRDRLEQDAIAQAGDGGLPIRPIVLFQAQPRGKEDSTTFEKIKNKLVAYGIPEHQIAIKTADINELKKENLMSPGSQIRYIITVNALKEGWDCPYAYILASLANKTSQVEVEQIVGRILRLPGAVKYGKKSLNMSYVLTSSNDFQNTLERIVAGLNNAGFTKRDCRVASAEDLPLPEPEPQPQPVIPLPVPPEPENEGTDSGTDDFINSDPSKVAVRTPEQGTSAVDDMLAGALQQGADFEQGLEQTGSGGEETHIPVDIADMKSRFQINEEFTDEVNGLALPQFYQMAPNSLFLDSSGEVLLTKEHLASGFSLKGQATNIDWKGADDDLYSIDIKEGKSGGVPKVFRLDESAQLYFKQQFPKLDASAKIRVCKQIVHQLIDSFDSVDSSELAAYIDAVIENMSPEQLASLEKSPSGFASRIKNHVVGLLNDFIRKQFDNRLATGRILCRPSYSFPASISPIDSTAIYDKSLYEAEESGNKFETELIQAITGLPNIRWWHRNIARTGFAINGFINHYPDFIVRTRSGKIVIIETKGDHPANEETLAKLHLGREWQEQAGPGYRYFLVFQDKDISMTGAYPMSEFLKILAEL